MADRSPTPDDSPDDTQEGERADRELADAAPDDSPDDEPTEEPAHDRSLTNRWWWQGAVAAATGVVVIVWQWSVISDGEAIAANWVMIGLGTLAIAAGGLILRNDRPVPSSTDDD